MSLKERLSALNTKHDEEERKKEEIKKQEMEAYLEKFRQESLDGILSDIKYNILNKLEIAASRGERCAYYYLIERSDFAGGRFTIVRDALDEYLNTTDITWAKEYVSRPVYEDMREDDSPVSFRYDFKW